MSQIARIHQAFLSSKGISTDSRQENKEVMFFALKGENFDGNKYVQDVLAKGAAYAVADDPSLREIENVFIVDNALLALQELARFHRRYLNIPIVAITGTNGKTTTKELIAAVLNEKYSIKATAGNFNNHIGVPLTLLSMDKSIELGIVEMGANHVGEIAELCLIAEPNYGLITNVGKAHLEGFGSFEGVKTAKGELYQYLKVNDGLMFINANNEYLQKMAAGINNRVEYGTSNGSIKGKIIDNNPFITIGWSDSNETTHRVKTNLIGEYNLENILSAICIGSKLEVDIKSIIRALENYQPTNNRSQFIKSDQNQIIMDAYNANPSSMQVALLNFDKIKASNKVLIIGGMKELGDVTVAEHQKVLDTISTIELSRVILIGEEFEELNKKYAFEYFADNQAVIETLNKEPITESYILIKGSRSNKLEELLSLL